MSSRFSSSVRIFLPSLYCLLHTSTFPFHISFIFLLRYFPLHSSLYALFIFRHFAISVHPSLPTSSRFLFLFFVDNHPSPLFSLSVLPLDTFPLLVLFLNRGRSPRLSLSPSRGRHTSFTILPRHSVLFFIATSEDTVQNWLERRSGTRFGTVIDWPDCRATQPSVPPSFPRLFDRRLVLPGHPSPSFNFAKMESHKKRS